MITHDGYGQITGFHMTGDLLGFDGIWDNRHAYEAIALEDSEVCVLPFDCLDALAAVTPSLRQNLYRILSRGARGDHDITLTFGSRPAEQRLVLFLLNLAERYQLRGYSASEFTLRMTRGDIASFLGLTIETVSRLFSHFHEEGLTQVQGRAIKVLDRPALRERIGGR
jgi:CRP/FNR family transcriptional regulator